MKRRPIPVALVVSALAVLAVSGGIDTAQAHGGHPRHWPLATLKMEMHTHLDMTAAEAVAHLQQKWAASVAAYDRVHRHILHMSDLLADGIVAQFPNRYR